MDKEKLAEIFKDYISNFNFNDEAIKRKYFHSLRVMEICEILSKNANFNSNDQNLAAIVGLLHDYARFPQWTKYKTYSDIESVDHGDLGVKLLFDEGDIKKFNILEENYDEIYDAIKYHNKYTYPDVLSEHNKLLCKIIRDADKIDILYLFSIDKTLILEDDYEISKEIIEDFYLNKSIDIKKVKSKNDKVMLDLAYVFDLNFEYSFKFIKEKKYIEKIYERVEHKDMFKEYFDYIIKYIDERIDNYVR